jgi:mercuric ion transport protein
MAFSGKTSLIASILAAIGVSVCCVGPLVLLVLGIGGAWISNLTALEPYRPWFIGLTFVFWVLAFRKLYGLSNTCAPNTPCADSLIRRRQRLVFWVVTVLLLALLAAPLIAPWFY